MTVEIDKRRKPKEADVFGWREPQLQGEWSWCHLIPRMHHALGAPGLIDGARWTTRVDS